MRLLIVSPSVPDPATHHGGGVYLGHLTQALNRFAELGLVSFRSPERTHVPEVFRWSATVPRTENRALGPIALRVNQMRLLKRWTAQRLPLVPAKHYSQAMPRLLKRALDEFRPDAALVEFAPMAQYLSRLTSLPTVFTDHEAGHPVRAFREGSWADRRDQDLWKRYVRAHYPLADRIQTLTSEDAEVVRAYLGRPIGIRQPFVDLPAESVHPEATRPVALFLGDYRHHPNPEAARVVAFEVWPKVRAQIPEAELWLAGRGGTEILAGLDQADGVRILGFVEDLTELLVQCRCMLTPVFSGGGSRIKVLTALAHGLPVVTNELGARGVSAKAPALARADDAAALVDPTLALLSDAGRAGEAGRAARAWAAEHLSPDGVARDQVEAIDALLRARA